MYWSTRYFSATPWYSNGHCGPQESHGWYLIWHSSRHMVCHKLQWHRSQSTSMSWSARGSFKLKPNSRKSKRIEVLVYLEFNAFDKCSRLQREVFWTVMILHICLVPSLTFSKAVPFLFYHMNMNLTLNKATSADCRCAFVKWLKRYKQEARKSWTLVWPLDFVKVYLPYTMDGGCD